MFSDIYPDKNFIFPLLVSSPRLKKASRRREEMGANLAVPGGNGFGVVTVVEAVDAVLEFLAYQCLILPAALSIGQPHPLTEVLGVIRGCFTTACCNRCVKNQTSSTAVVWLKHKWCSQGQSEPSRQPQHRSWLEGEV